MSNRHPNITTPMDTTGKAATPTTAAHALSKVRSYTGNYWMVLDGGETVKDSVGLALRFTYNEARSYITTRKEAIARAAGGGK